MQSPKSAATDHEIHELIRNRWSPRAFSADPVSLEELRSILEAGRWAASCFNEQPWRFVVARKEDPEAFARLLGCLGPANQIWAKDAAVLLLSVARLDFTRNGKPNRHAFHDVGQAVAQLALQATALGLAVHQMAGFDRARAHEVLGIPEGFEAVAAIAVGRPGDPDALSAELRERELAPRSRRPHQELFFGGRWGEPVTG